MTAKFVFLLKVMIVAILGVLAVGICGRTTISIAYLIVRHPSGFDWQIADIWMGGGKKVLPWDVVIIPAWAVASWRSGFWKPGIKQLRPSVALCAITGGVAGAAVWLVVDLLSTSAPSQPEWLYLAGCMVGAAVGCILYDVFVRLILRSVTL